MAQPHDLPFLENDHQAECKPYQAATGFAPIPGTDYKLYYEWFTPGSARQELQQGEVVRQQQQQPESPANGAGRQPFRVLGIMGFCCGCKDWAPLVYLLMTKMQHVDLEMAIFDNRGFGQSSVPSNKKEYSTDIMAHDAVAVMDHLGWKTAHVIGLSLGGMITLKVASLHPDRVESATALSVVAGGKQLLPHSARGCWFTCLGACAATPSKEDKETINMQFSPATLKQEAPDGRKYKSVLREQYAEARVQNAPQEKNGRSGQLHAILTNKLSAKERAVLRQGKPPVLLVHGASDLVADRKYAERMAKDIQASIKVVPGAHLLTREVVVEVADAWLSFAAQRGGAPFSSIEASAALKQR